jgi:nucleoid-associated protein YgaU
VVVLGVVAAFLVSVTPRHWPEAGEWTVTPEAPVLAGTLAAAYGCLGWLVLLVVAVAARTRVRLPGRAFAERVLGVAVVTAAAGVIAAGPAVAEGGPVAAGPFDRLAEPPAAVVVRRGDTLWGIAARHLGGRATPEAVAAEWPRWYAANRAVVGPDPHLILPGQRLRPPADGAAR